MNHELVKLKDVISKEIKAYQDLLVLAKKKREILVKNAVEALEETVYQEEELLSAVHRCEKERTMAVEAVATSLGLSTEGLTFQQIIDAMPEADQTSFALMRAELKDVIAQLARANALNRMLLETHMSYISFCVGALTDHTKGLDMYSASGKSYTEKTSGHIMLNHSV